MLQKRVLVFIKSFMNNYGYPPTVREIAKGTDISSTATVHSSLNALENKGYIYRDNGQSRSIVLSGAPSSNGIYSIPLLEKGNAKVGFVDVPKSLVVDREGVFAVKANRNISESSILEGDILIAKACKITDNIKDGDLVIYDDHTVGVYYEENGIYDYFGFNDTYGDSVSELYALDAFDSNESETAETENNIMGKVIVCIRNF